MYEYIRNDLLYKTDENKFDYSAKLPLSMKPAMFLRGHRGCINTCSFDPYGNYELTGSDDGCVWIWDIGTRNPNPKILLRPHHTNLFTTNFLSENSFISGANDANVVHVTLRESEAIATTYYNHHIKKVNSSFVIDENTFVTCSHDSTIRIFDIRCPYKNTTSNIIPYLSLDNDFDYDPMDYLESELSTHQIEPQGYGGGPTVKPLSSDIAQDSILFDFQSEPYSQVFVMNVHPTNKHIFAAGLGNSEVRLFDLRNVSAPVIGWDFSQYYSCNLSVAGCAFDDTGSRLAVSLWGGDIHIVSTDSAGSNFDTINACDNGPGGQPPPNTPEQIIDEIENLGVVDFFLSLGIDIFEPESTENEQTSTENEQTSTENEQTLAENEQTSTENEQTSTENEQTLTENEQTSTENEQTSAENESNRRITIHLIGSERTVSLSSFRVTRHPFRLNDQVICSGHKNVQTIKAVNWIGDSIVTGSDDGYLFFYSSDGKLVNSVKYHDENVNVVTVHKEKRLIATSGVDHYAILWEPSGLFEISK